MSEVKKAKEKTGFFARMKAWIGKRKRGLARTKKKIKKILLYPIGYLFGSEENPDATWRVLRPISIAVISLVLVGAVFVTGISFALKTVFGPADQGNDDPVLFNISNGASMSFVASKLKESGLVKTSLGIKLLADFTSVSTKIISGEYVLDRSMSAQDILDIITDPSAAASMRASYSSAKVTLIEGRTLEDFAETLHNAGVISSKESFLEDCRTGIKFSDYYYISALQNQTGLRYALEGYLFPDTYDFYLDSQNEEVVDKLLKRFEQIFSEEFYQRSLELGMSTHEVITLASIIEKEGIGDDQKKISAVFHNRLKAGMRLESDTTVQYALGIKSLTLSAEELNVDSPYNTYLVSGLPAGPVCNPSKKAIEAALYPDTEILNGGYYYFTLTDPYEGTVAYSKTLEEHQKLVERWRPVWEAYERQRKG